MNRLLLAASALALVACGHAPPPDVAPPPVVIPFAPSDVPCCVELEQHVEVTSPYGASTFDVFVESHKAELVLVGFTTYGVRAFTLVHDATGLHVDAAPMRELAAVPFDRIVRDVYAAFLVDELGAGRADVVLEDRVVEGRRTARTVVFDATSERPETVVIDYGPAGWARGEPPPESVVVTHRAPPLRIAITTRSTRPSP